MHRKQRMVGDGPQAQTRARINRRSFITVGAATILSTTPARGLLRGTPVGGLLREAFGGHASSRRDPRPSNTAAPLVAGAAVRGQVVAATKGAWTHSPTSYAYEWHRAHGSHPASGRRSYTIIPGATTRTYELQRDDEGARIAVKVIATNAHGTTGATSAYTPTITFRPLVNEARPAISDTSPKVGEIISVTNGIWS
jgi:hypothetical protein